MEDIDSYISAVQAAQYLGCTRQRVYQLVEEGAIGRKVGGFWLFTREELDKFKDLPRKTNRGRPPKINSAPTLS